MDHQGLAPVDLILAADPDAVAIALAEVDRDRPRRKPVAAADANRLPNLTRAARSPSSISHARCARPSATRDVSLTHLPLSWNGAWWPFRHPLDFLGSDGGGGIGGGPGHLGRRGARAQGLRPAARSAICGDGDFLMGVTALWTAAHYRIPLLIVVANNRSFFNDEVHQERVARMRNRPVENKWIGQRISDPDIDLAALARAQGALGFGPVDDATSQLARDVCARRSPRSSRAASRSSMCASSRAMRRP